MLEHGWVDAESLARAVHDQASSGLRLCSLLIARSALQLDQASRALGEQLGTAAVLRRHLQHRDRSLAALLPADVATSRVALPIGRRGDGTLIVCVRDPSPQLRAALGLLLGHDIVLAVAPAGFIERIVQQTYAQPELDVAIDIEEHDADASELDIDIAVDDDSSGDDVFAIEIESPSDDEDQSDDLFAIEIEPSEPEQPITRSRALPVNIPVARPGMNEPARDSLDTLIASFPDIDDLEWLLDVVAGYVAKRWTASLMLAISERRAVGVRGHGRRLKPSAVRAFVLVLSEPSIVQLARDERRLVDEAPATPGRGHVEMIAVLGGASHPVAAPITKRGQVSYVLVVGDPIIGEPEDAALDLEVLVEALSSALEKM